MLPFGPRLTTVFASRWKALFWAAGVMLTAYLTATEARQDEPADQQASVASSDSSAAPRSPWAK